MGAWKRRVMTMVAVMAMMLFATAAFAQDAFYEETFDDATAPDDWFVTDLTDDGGGLWTYTDTAPAGETFSAIAGYFFLADSSADSSEFSTELISASIDCSDQTLVSVNFDHAVLFAEGASLFLAVGTPASTKADDDDNDDATDDDVAVDDDDDDFIDDYTWTVVTSLLISADTAETTAAADITDIAAGVDDVRLKWIYETPDTKSTGFWAVDNVKLLPVSTGDDDDDTAPTDDDDTTEVAKDEDDEEEKTGCWLTRRDDD